MINPRFHLRKRNKANAAWRRVMAKQSLNRRSIKMECTRLERESKQKDQNGSWKTVNLKGFENIKKIAKTFYISNPNKQAKMKRE